MAIFYNNNVHDIGNDFDDDDDDVVTGNGDDDEIDNDCSDDDYNDDNNNDDSSSLFPIVFSKVKNWGEKKNEKMMEKDEWKLCGV